MKIRGQAPWNKNKEVDIHEDDIPAKEETES